MLGLFAKKDWNVIAVIFEKADMYRVNGNRGHGSTAVTIRDGVKKHARTIYWAVFDQRGGFLEGEPGPGKEMIAGSALQRLIKEMPTNKTVRSILSMLESGQHEKAARPLEWTGYPVKS